ncbi:MAG: hypothetical protein EA351_05560 [Gemmatimonadales bacterium]|nr:MAG: hypothetical protein EA351_05560 [Gemmatimonadales bacterium]
MQMHERVDRSYEAVQSVWDRWSRGGGTGRTLIFIFIASLLLIEANRLGWFPEALAEHLPDRRFQAINAAFTAFLVFEVIGLAFGFSNSIAEVAGKQLEIFSLILLRKSFTELQELPIPITWTSIEGPVAHLVSDAVGALVIFGILAWYYSIQKRQPIIRSEEARGSFLSAMRGITLLLLSGIAVIGAWTGAQFFMHGEIVAFFDAVFTLFIFIDVLVVFVSLQYNLDYGVVFRNTGFAISTVMIRLALAGPPFLNAILGVVAALFAVGVTWVYNRFEGPTQDRTDGP